MGRYLPPFISGVSARTFVSPFAGVDCACESGCGVPEKREDRTLGTALRGTGGSGLLRLLQRIKDEDPSSEDDEEQEEEDEVGQIETVNGSRKQRRG